jgi:hypothetical protein
MCYIFFHSVTEDILKHIDNLKKGDIIQLGQKSGHFFYEYILEDKKSSGGDIQRVENNLSLKKYKIKDAFIKHKSVKEYFNTNAYVIISFGTKGIFGVTYYADIYEAIKNGEIVIKKVANQ